MKEKALIIGGGVGGLFTGAFLAKEGYQVTVLDKNRRVGGGLHNFVRKGVLYQTGMHLIGGFQEGGSMRAFLQYLGIWDRLRLANDGLSSPDVVVYGSPRKTFVIPKGREAFTRYLCTQYPHQAEQIRAYVQQLYDLTEEISLFHLRPNQQSIYDHGEMFFWPADRLIAHFIQDAELRDLLAYLSCTYAGETGCTMAYVHALINVMYINSTCQFLGGSQQLADLLAGVIEEHGGSVLTAQHVKEVRTSNQCVTEVLTDDGHRYEADQYIAAIQPSALFRLLPDHVFSRAMTQRITALPDTYSAFTVYIKLKPHTIPQTCSPVFYQDKVGQGWNQADLYDDAWPHTFMSVTPPTERDEQFATHLIVMVPMQYSLVQRWEDSVVGRRGEAYVQFKAEHTQKVLRCVKNIYPNIEDCIDDCFASTPLTIRDYLGSRNGSLYGYRKDSNNVLSSHMSIRTKITNLFLTGQNIHVHGLCGVAMTALETAEEIVGSDVILSKIR